MNPRSPSPHRLATATAAATVATLLVPPHGLAECWGQSETLPHGTVAIASAHCPAFVVDTSPGGDTLTLEASVSIVVSGTAVSLSFRTAEGPVRTLRLTQGAYVADVAPSGRTLRVCPVSGSVSGDGEAGAAAAPSRPIEPGWCLEWPGESALVQVKPPFDVDAAFRGSIPEPPPLLETAPGIDYAALSDRLARGGRDDAMEGDSRGTELSGGATCLDTSSGNDGAGPAEQGGTQVEIEPKPGVMQVRVELVRQ